MYIQHIPKKTNTTRDILCNLDIELEIISAVTNSLTAGLLDFADDEISKKLESQLKLLKHNYLYFRFLSTMV